MFTILGATRTLTQETIVLYAALGVFLLGIVLIALGVVRRNSRRIEAQNQPIDTSRFQQPQEAPALEETPAPMMAEATRPEAAPTEATAMGAAPLETTGDAALIPQHPPAAEIPEPVFIAPAFSAPAFAAIRPILLCNGYGAAFGPKLVLTDMSFAVPDHGITTIMGPANSGRSTLLRALGGALGQSGLFHEWGHAWFRGAPLTAENRPLLVTQRAPLVQSTVLENLLFHLRGRTGHMAEDKQRQWAAGWLSQAGAGHLAGQLDQPFMALDPLSQRIVTILREAVAEPALLLLDEPAQGLNEAEASTLLALLQSLAGFTPLLLVLQNHKHARRISDRILLIAGGQVQAACGTAEFFDAPPNAIVEQFIGTGSCDVPAPDASAISQLGPIPAVMPLFSAAWAPPEPEAPATAPHPGLPASEPAPEAFAPEQATPPGAEDITSHPSAGQATPTPLTPDTLAAIKDEIRNTLAAELDEAAPETPAHTVDETMPEAPDEAVPQAWEGAAQEETLELEETLEPAAAIPPAEPVAGAPVFTQDAGTPGLDEAERLTAPVNFNASPATPVTIEMEHEAAELQDIAAPDDLPPIALSANMVQSVPLPPRAAAAQMSAPAADPQRYENAAVFRHPGSNAPGPRGFVWIEEGRLAATPAPGFSAPIETDLALLKAAGITMLITLTEQDLSQDLLASHGLRNVYFPIAEQNAPATDAANLLIAHMNELLNQGEVLAVHSHASLGRTGTILAAYMVKEQGLSAQAALSQIRRFNQQFVQTDEQEDFLMEFEVQQEQTVLHHRATGQGPKLLR